MNKHLNLKASAMLLALAAMATSCSDDDNDGPYLKVVDFENTGIELAGPTSYGENLYETYTGTQFTTGEIAVTANVKLQFGINVSSYTGNIDFYGGGAALSQWNYRTNPADKTAADWWYSYLNQCSVYNTASTDGTNRGAGADGSNTFMIINGYINNAFSSNTCASISFSNSAELALKQVSICPTSYVYGILTNGNPYGNDGGKSIKEANGWFRIEAYGYDANGTPTNGGQPAVKYFCDYRTTANPTVELFSTWQSWDLSSLGKVNRVEFNFTGSDTGSYGLNTPAYACLDNLVIEIAE